MGFEHLAPGLAETVTWNATSAPLTGDMAGFVRAGQWDINKLAHYLPVYDSVFGPYRTRNIRMLEIGVNLGGSLELWRKYFRHRLTKIVGIDNNDRCAQFNDPDKNVFVRIGAQQDPEFLQSLIDEFGPFDIVLDDGSHIPSWTLKSFQFLFARGLRDGGVYVVEDLHACYSPDSTEPFHGPELECANDGSPTFIEFVKELMDVMHAHYLQTPTGDDMDKWEPNNPVYQGSFDVPYATTIVDRIDLRDAIVAIHRKPKELPRMIRRWSMERMAATRNPSDADNFLNHRFPFLGEADRTRKDWIS